MTGGPPTPPDTPGATRDSASKLKGNETSNVNNQGINNQGGVVAGNIYGYNLIIGTINVAVDSAKNLSGNIHSFLAKVEIATQRLRSMADKVGATASTLDNINDLVAIQAKKDGIPLPDNPRDMKLAIEDGSLPRGPGEHPEAEILKLRCFKNIISASTGVRNLFDDFSEKIQKAGNAIDLLGHTDHQTRMAGLSTTSRPQKDVGGDKLELTEAEREAVYLTEKDIDFMESGIESHKTELLMRFTVFQFALNDEKREVAERVAVDCWRMIKMLSERLLGSGDVPPADPRDNSIHQPGYQNRLPFEKPIVFPSVRPFSFPNVALLTPFYMGWVFYKTSPPDNPPLQLSRSQKPSWLFSVPIRMLLSTEELYLKVISQISARAQHRRMLEDDCAALLKSQSRKALVDKLLRTQNTHLQKFHPQVEWILAGLASDHGHSVFNKSKKKNKNNKTASGGGKIQKFIEVILKTQWRAPGPVPQPQGPGSPGGLNVGRPVDPNIMFGGLPNSSNTKIPLHHARSRHIARRDLPREARATWNSDHGITPASHHRPGRQRYWKHKVPWYPHPRPHPSNKSKDETTIEVSKPEFRFVKKPGKKTMTKTKRNNDKSARKSTRVYIELYKPGLYSHRKSSLDKSQTISAPNLPNLAHHPRPARFRAKSTSSQTPPSPLVIDEDNTYRPPPSPREAISVEEEKEVVEELFEEWEELTDKKGKKKSKRRRQNDSDSNVGISRALMRQVERQSHYRMMMERHSIERMTVEMTMQPHTPLSQFLKPVYEQRRGRTVAHMAGPNPSRHQPAPESYQPHMQKQYHVKLSEPERPRIFHSHRPTRQVHVQEVHDYSGDSDNGKEVPRESREVQATRLYKDRPSKIKTKHTHK